MKIDPDFLFIGTFVICMCPWLVYAFWVVKNMQYRMSKSLCGVRGFNPLQWRGVGVDRKSDPQAQFIWEQGLKWMKICFITWIASFILLVALLVGLAKLGLLSH